MTHIVLLRGINVNGIRIEMKPLKLLLAENGLKGVETILATGNLIVDSPMGSGELKIKLEALLSRAYGYEAYVQVIDEACLLRLKRHFEQLVTVEDHHVQVVFCQDAQIMAQIEAESKAIPLLADEQVIALESELIWSVQKGDTLSSSFGKKVLGSKRYKPYVTTRNMQTVLKIEHKLGNK